MSRDAYLYMVPEDVKEEDGVFDCAPFWPTPLKKAPRVRLPRMTFEQVSALWEVLRLRKVARKGGVFDRMLHPGSREEGGMPPVSSLNARLVGAIAALGEAECRGLAADWASQGVMARRSEAVLARLVTAIVSLCRRAKAAGRTVFLSERNES